jgi:hypothetical protein
VRRAKKLWIGGAVIALAHNITAEDGDTLSEAMDDWIFAHPVLTRAVIVVFALHLANAVKQQADPVHWAFVVARRRRVVVVVEATGETPR